jgi:hypothetical protein
MHAFGVKMNEEKKRNNGKMCFINSELNTVEGKHIRQRDILNLTHGHRVEFHPYG